MAELAGLRRVALARSRGLRRPPAACFGWRVCARRAVWRSAAPPWWGCAPTRPGPFLEGLCAPSPVGRSAALPRQGRVPVRVRRVCARRALGRSAAPPGQGSFRPGPSPPAAPWVACCCSDLGGRAVPSADGPRLAARAGGIWLPFPGGPLCCLEGLCAPSPVGRSAAPPRLAPVAGEGACVCAEGLCAPSFRAERGASAAGPFPRALAGLLVGCGRGCLAAPFPGRVGLGLVSRRFLVLTFARPLPLLPTPVPGGLAAGGLVVGCAFRVLPPRPLPSLAAPRVPLPLLRTCALGLLVGGWWWSRPRVAP